MEKELSELAQYGCEIAKKEGAEFADVAVGTGRNISVDIERNAIKHGDANFSSGISIRAFIKGGMGFASATSLDKDEIMKAAKKATELAKIAQPDPDFVSLVPPKEYSSVDRLFDDKIAGLDVGSAIKYLISNIETARQLNSEAILNGGIEVGFSEGVLANSLGVLAPSKGTNISMGIQASIRKSDDVGFFFDFDYARMFSDFNPNDIGLNAVKMAMKFLGSRHIKGGVMPVILSPLSAHSLFSGLCSNANAEDIQRNRSYLCNKKGERIASEKLTIKDEPLIPGGMSSGKCDGEGFPHKTLKIIEKGVLKTYLHNSYTANKAKEESTGHSTRGGIAPTNVNPELGTKKEAELIKEIKEGLYIAEGGLHPNSVTGDISATVDFGFMIENGEIAYPVRNVMVGINMFELLANIDEVSSDFRQEPGVIMPSVRINNVRVTGAA